MSPHIPPSDAYSLDRVLPGCFLNGSPPGASHSCSHPSYLRIYIRARFSSPRTETPPGLPSFRSRPNPFISLSIGSFE
uniref:Uncharacterized protein n=1 Tax=Picea glauca TaxID=3330 RepID=A0A101LYL9_PICGL|nr:hypothetical protein ABT39_MTgene5902 [Picea glauca]QHR92073.1 hypothetical protein Q903MT_gene6109 [Picea sitchensis]